MLRNLDEAVAGLLNNDLAAALIKGRIWPRNWRAGHGDLELSRLYRLIDRPILETR